MLAFLFARYLLGQLLQDKYQLQLDRFNREMEASGSRYLLTLRLIPIFPFFLINFLSGLTRVPLKTFAWTTALGIIPGTIIFAYAGQPDRLDQFPGGDPLDESDHGPDAPGMLRSFPGLVQPHQSCKKPERPLQGMNFY